MRPYDSRWRSVPGSSSEVLAPGIPTRLLLLLAAAAPGPAGAACPPASDAGMQVTAAAPDPASGRASEVTLAWRALEAPITVGRPFALLVNLCPAHAALRAVDATMPEHRHGMNYRPSVHRLGPDRWRVDGLLWHMSGRWEMRFDVVAGGVAHTLRHDVVLE